MTNSRVETIVEVPGYSGRFVFVKCGSLIRITDVCGTQIGDLFAISQENDLEFLSASVTRSVTWRLFPQVGQAFYTTSRRPILTFLEDHSPGIHDMLFATADDCQRQRHGTDQQRHRVLGGRDPCRLALHRSGQAGSESLHESFNGCLRDEFLNETLFTSFMHARLALEEWRRDYNTVRPHSRIGWLTPAAHAATFSPQPGQGAALLDGCAPWPVAPIVQEESNAQPYAMLARVCRTRFFLTV
jgi:hypothetical protein